MVLPCHFTGISLKVSLKFNRDEHLSSCKMIIYKVYPPPRKNNGPTSLKHLSPRPPKQKEATPSFNLTAPHHAHHLHSLPVYHICPTFAPALALGSLANAGDQERTKTRPDGTVPCSPSCLAQNCGLSPPPFTRQVARAAVSYSASESLLVAPWYVENGLLRGLFWLFWR